MQLASIATSPAAHTAAVAPAIDGGIDFAGTGRFTKFSAHATKFVYGDEAGYGTLQEAIDAATMLTVGARQSAAGIFELDGRFHARRLDNKLTFATGATWEGVWRLEQYPADRELLDGRLTGVTRTEALKAVVDGMERFDVSALPVA
ncbi:MAG: hypothetical protein JWL76_221 [Thermoleophilia bacterium]|nr:hypothetical protein [Thermoleophilia bacterium]